MAFRNTRSSSRAHCMAAAVLVALLFLPSLPTSTFAEIGKTECTHVDYLCLYHLDLCTESCKAKASEEGSENFDATCDGTGPDPRRQCCCTVKPPGPPPPFWPPNYTS